MKNRKTWKGNSDRMGRRTALRVGTVLAAAILLSGCGGASEDAYEQGCKQLESGAYEEALDTFREGAQKGDDQAKTAEQIMEGYLNAKEAYQLGDPKGAQEFLEGIPEEYRDYAVADDIDSLRREISGKAGEEPVPPAGGRDEKAFSAREAIDMALQQAQAELDSGLYDRVQEILQDVRAEDCSQSQKEKLEQLQKDAQAGAEQQEKAETANPDNQTFTPDKAAKILQDKYGIQGDLSQGLASHYDDKGNKYYELTFQTEEGGKPKIVKARIYGDGRVEEEKQ